MLSLCKYAPCCLLRLWTFSVGAAMLYMNLTVDEVKLTMWLPTLTDLSGVLSFVVGELPHWKGSMGMWGDVGTAIIYLFESMEQILLKLRTTFDISNFEIVMLSTTESESICVCLLSIFGSQLWSRENKCRPLKTQRETESVPIYPVSRRFPGRFGNFRVGR